MVVSSSTDNVLSSDNVDQVHHQTMVVQIHQVISGSSSNMVGQIIKVDQVHQTTITQFL
ncbi:hypothetical protein [Leuconostoc citreum]|uniref:hypothetical protein n=1 Tax=Leuconostoc citreum TaxID=33964 RepID=UPI001FA91DB3|nr:hypothetical protein [Leuconostoc citreum]